MEADHTIFLVNASIDLTIFNLQRRKQEGMQKIQRKDYCYMVVKAFKSKTVQHNR